MLSVWDGAWRYDPTQHRKSDLSVEFTSVSSVCIVVRRGVHAHGIQRVCAGQHTHAHEQVGNQTAFKKHKVQLLIT